MDSIMIRKSQVTLEQLNDMYPVFVKQVKEQLDHAGEKFDDVPKSIIDQMIQDKLKIYVKGLK